MEGKGSGRKGVSSGRRDVPRESDPKRAYLGVKTIARLEEVMRFV